MSPQDWKRLKSLYEEALELAPTERTEFLERLESREPVLAAELRTLLAEEYQTPHTVDSLGSASVREFIISLGASTPEQMGGYRILRELGRGGSSVVFRASRGQKSAVDGGSDVAIKVLRFANWDQFRLRQFSVERQIMGQLDHPNIAKMLDWGTTATGLPYLVLELIEGTTLTAFCAEHALSLRDRVSLFGQVLEAVGFAHRNSIIHRDLKPSNILVTPNGQIKLLDFGISKLFESDPDATATLERKYTPAYASPEQVRGLATGRFSDIYSLGVILYELATGRMPYDVSNSSAYELSLAVIDKAPVAPSRISPHLPKEMDKVVLRALEKSPQNRYPSVEEFAAGVNQLSLVEPAGPHTGFTLRLPLIAVACALIAILVLLNFWRFGRQTPLTTSNALAAYPITAPGEFAAYPASSRDGQVVYASDRDGNGVLHIWIQKRVGPPVRLTSGTSDDTDPALSADGKWVAFHSERDPKGIYMVPSKGGSAAFLAPFGQSPRFSPVGGALVYWAADPHTRFGSVWRISLDRSREPFQVARDFEDAHNPMWTPDGRSVLLCGTRRANGGPQESHDFWVVSEDGSQPVKTGIFPLLNQHHIEPHVPPLRSTSIAWTQEGFVLAARQEGSFGLWTIPFSRQTWKATGTPRPLKLAPAIAKPPDQKKWQILHPFFSESTYFFARASADLQIWNLPIDPETAQIRGEPLRLTNGTFEHSMPSVSLDGQTLVFLGQRNSQTTIYSRDRKNGAERPLPGEAIQSNRVKLSGDGCYAYWRVMEGQGRMRQAIYRMLLQDGTRQRVCEDCGGPVSVSFDGKTVIYENGSAVTRIGVLLADSGNKGDAIYHAYHPVHSARLSPDSRWLAFIIDRGYDGRQLLVSPFTKLTPVDQSKWVPVTPPDGVAEEPAWSPGGKWIYYFDRRDGFRCLWARRWDSLAGQPSGAPLSIQHFHTARFSPLSLVDRDARYIGLSVARNGLFVTLSEFESRVWRADKP